MQLNDKHLQIIKRHDRTDTQFLICFPNLVVKLKHLDSTSLPFSAISLVYKGNNFESNCQN